MTSAFKSADVTRAPGRKSILDFCLLASCAALGYGLNLYPVSFAFGLDFILGGIPGFVVWRLRGLGAGIAVTAVASLATIQLWHHPYAVIVFTSEIAFIGLMHRWRGISPLHSSVLFWGTAGIFLLFITYHGLMAMDHTSWLLVWAKQAVNGVTALIAAEMTIFLAVITFPALRLSTHSCFSYKIIILDFLVLFALVPLVIGMVVLTQGKFHETLDAAAARVEALSAVATRVTFDRQRLVMTLIESALAVQAESGSAGPDIQVLPPAAKELLTRNGVKIVAFRPPHPAPEDFEPGSTGWMELAEAADDNVLGTGQTDLKNITYSIVIPGTDDRRGGPLEFLVQDEWLNSELKFILGNFSLAAAFSDRKLQSGHDADVLVPFLDHHATRPGSPDVLYALAKDDARPARNSVMNMWSSSALVGTFSMPLKNGPYLSVSRSLSGPILEYRRTLLWLLVGCLLAIVIAVPVGTALTRRIVWPLGSLGAFARNLPDQITEKSKVVFPVSRLAEISELTGAFEGMAQEIVSRTQQVHELKRRLEHLMANVPVVIFNFSVEVGEDGAYRIGRRAYVSAAIKRLFGYDPSEMPQPDEWLSLVHPNDRHRVVKQRASVLDGDGQAGEASCEYRLLLKDGSYQWVYSELLLLRDDRGDAEITGFLLDRQSLKETQQQLLHASKMVTLGEMATGLAHELNQPLNVMGLAAFNARARLDRPTVEDNREYLVEKLDRIKDQVGRAAAIIDHMRIFGRKAMEEERPFQPGTSVRRSVSMVGEQLRLRGIEIFVQDNSREAMVLGHSGLLEQVVLNLLTNARDSIEAKRGSAHGTPDSTQDRVEIAIDLDEGRRWLTLKVSDTGNGIPQEVLSKLFEPFFTTKEPGEGTGLGLSLSYGIVHEMRGEIGAANREAGAEFTIILPCVPQHMTEITAGKSACATVEAT